MNLVMIAETNVLRCDICGATVGPGDVYVLLYTEDKNGQLRWQTAHLECDARRRGAQKVRLRTLPVARKR